MNRYEENMLERIKELTPLRFEQLIYDLLVRRGLINVRWRTPGPDGGRDIEGEHPFIEFTGRSRTEQYYVECKRYESAIDWPTVHKKLAYAQNHNVDVLLFCTTSSLSPKCKDEVRTYEAKGLRPRIHAWEGADIDFMISSDSFLAHKYGFIQDEASAALSLMPLLTLNMKVNTQAYSDAVIKDILTPSLELASTLSELAYVRLKAQKHGEEHHETVPERDMFDWCEYADIPRLAEWDPYALRAITAGIRFITREKTIVIESSAEAEKSLLLKPSPNTDSNVARDLLNSITLLTDLEWKYVPGGVYLVAR